MIYIFDLDLTIWDTFDKHGNQIWAKQLIPPYTISGDTITDDVFSTCTLRKGVRNYLKFLWLQGHQIGFVSVGAYRDLPFELQPSYKNILAFQIEKYFNNIKVLEYKTYDKTKAIKNIKDKIIFYDDSQKVLDSLKAFKNVTAVDSTDIKDWYNMIGKDYD